VPDRSAPRLLALHELRVKGYVDRDDPEFKELEAAGLARRRAPGWSLTPDGRAAHAEAVAGELSDEGRAEVEAAYRRFLALNPSLLQVCTDWQLRTGAVNDHSDAAYDADVIARLGAVHDQVLLVLADLARALDRFDGYTARLQNALDRVRAGEHDWFTRPILDSYHAVWFELHEDLLATLGIERGHEGRPFGGT
jgi:hypothetical protein